MSKFEQTKIFEKVKIEYVACNTGEVHHLELAFMGWQALAKYINSLEKEKNGKQSKSKRNGYLNLHTCYIGHIVRLCNDYQRYNQIKQR